MHTVVLFLCRTMIACGFWFDIYNSFLMLTFYFARFDGSVPAPRSFTVTFAQCHLVHNTKQSTFFVLKANFPSFRRKRKSKRYARHAVLCLSSRFCRREARLSIFIFYFTVTAKCYPSSETPSSPKCSACGRHTSIAISVMVG